MEPNWWSPRLRSNELRTRDQSRGVSVRENTTLAQAQMKTEAQTKPLRVGVRPDSLPGDEGGCFPERLSGAGRTQFPGQLKGMRGGY